jgi:acetolactate synthase I/II/III large subunit
MAMVCKTGAQIVVDGLKQEGCEVIFGLPGGSLLDIFDELPKSDIRFVLVRHEQGAAHMADGYARSTGKVGVCMATSGPGATNLVTGLATAYMDGIPLVALTGQVPTPMIGNDAFQEADVVGITRPVTKYNFLIKHVSELAPAIKQAFYIASTGKPGPVLIDIPKDVQRQVVEEYKYPESVNLRGYRVEKESKPETIQKAARMIAEAKRPVIYAGGGAIASGAHDEIYELATKCNIPVTTTLMGLGAFPENHKLSLKMLGMHGTAYANLAMVHADLILALGARFDDRITGKTSEFAKNSRVIHADIDPTSINKTITADCHLLGDLKQSVAAVNQIVKPGDYSEWVKQVLQWKESYPLTYERDDMPENELKPQFVIESIYEVTRGNAVITTEVGQHQMWAAQYYTHSRPRSFCTSGGLGTMGYGFPAAIGAKVGRPDEVVIDIAGDGSIQMCIQELATAVNYNIPVVIAILNNHYLGMVRQWQELFYEKIYSGVNLSGKDLLEPKDAESRTGMDYVPDFVKLAEAYGAMGIRVRKKEDVVPTLEMAVKSNKVVVIDFMCCQEENVFPMVPAGAALEGMFLNKDKEQAEPQVPQTEKSPEGMVLL